MISKKHLYTNIDLLVISWWLWFWGKLAGWKLLFWCFSIYFLKVILLLTSVWGSISQVIIYISSNSSTNGPTSESGKHDATLCFHFRYLLILLFYVSWVHNCSKMINILLNGDSEQFLWFSFFAGTVKYGEIIVLQYYIWINEWYHIKSWKF